MKLTCAIVEDDTVARLMIENLAEKTNQLIVKGYIRFRPGGRRMAQRKQGRSPLPGHRNAGSLRVCLVQVITR